MKSILLLVLLLKTLYQFVRMKFKTRAVAFEEKFLLLPFKWLTLVLKLLPVLSLKEFGKQRHSRGLFQVWSSRKWSFAESSKQLKANNLFYYFDNNWLTHSFIQSLNFLEVLLFLWTMCCKISPTFISTSIWLI